MTATVQIARIEPLRSSLFYSYARLEALLHIKGVADETAAKELRVSIVPQHEPTSTSMQKFQHHGIVGLGRHKISIEALIVPETFPNSQQLVAECFGTRKTMDVETFARATYDLNFEGSIIFPDLVEHVEAFARSHGRRPKLLDLGGRPRSGNYYGEQLGPCDITVFDIVPGEGVDVVGDAHELSSHFPEEHFDFVFCASVFEHLLMPWKVALELNKVMRSGGYGLIKTHQTLGMHDLPWDFWRYSSSAWDGLFNARTGFKVVKAGMGQKMQLVTVGWAPSYRNSEAATGFENAGVLIQKTGPTDLSWNVSLKEAVKTSYPTAGISNPRRELHSEVARARQYPTGGLIPSLRRRIQLAKRVIARNE